MSPPKDVGLQPMNVLDFTEKRESVLLYTAPPPVFQSNTTLLLQCEKKHDSNRKSVPVSEGNCCTIIGRTERCESTTTEWRGWRYYSSWKLIWLFTGCNCSIDINAVRIKSIYIDKRMMNDLFHTLGEEEMIRKQSKRIIESCTWLNGRRR